MVLGVMPLAWNLPVLETEILHGAIEEMGCEQGEVLLGLAEHQAQGGAAAIRPRLAPVPPPMGTSAVSLCTTWTSAGVTPSASAAIWAKMVAVPWPCGESPVWTVIWPDGSMMTRA